MAITHVHPLTDARNRKAMLIDISRAPLEFVRVTADRARGKDLADSPVCSGRAKKKSYCVPIQAFTWSGWASTHAFAASSSDAPSSMETITDCISSAVQLNRVRIS